MANQPGREKPPHWKRGDRVKADDLNALANAAPGRLVGGGEVEIQATPGGAVIRKRPSRQAKGAPDTIVIQLTGSYEGEDAEEGEYEFELYEGSGPAQGRAIELHGREGLPGGLRVIARRAGGIWYFDAAAVEVYYEIVSIQDNTLGVRLLQNNSTEAVEGAPTITIWRAWPMQREAYDGRTIDGVTYSYTSSQERHSSGDAEEDEVVVPRYVVGERVKASLPVNGIPGGPANRMVECDEGRAWARKATGA